MEKKLGDVRLYENKDLTELESKQCAVYNQIIDIEKSIDRNLEDITKDRFLEGLNIELSKEGLTAKGNKRTLQRMQEGLLINKEFLKNYCLKNSAKGLPEWFDMSLLKSNKDAKIYTQNPDERMNNKYTQMVLDKKELKLELKKLKELKENFKKHQNKYTKQSILELQARIQAKYM